MAWLGSWIKNTVGSWFGSDEPDPEEPIRRGALYKIERWWERFSTSIPLFSAKQSAPVYVNMAATLAGRSTFSPVLNCHADISARLTGSGLIRSAGYIDTTSADEQEMMMVLLLLADS